MRKNRGFTLIELLIVVAMLGIIGIGICWLLIGKTICAGNFYFSETKVWKAITVQMDENISQIINIKRSPWALSEVTTRNTSGTQKVFYVDTNIMQDIKIHDVKPK